MASNISIKKINKSDKHKKELNSLRNKMGSKIFWFDSLSEKKQYDILFAWKRHKNLNKLKKPEYITFKKYVPLDPKKPYGRKKLINYKKLVYPPSFKHFIKPYYESPVFQPKKTTKRDVIIDSLLK